MRRFCWLLRSSFCFLLLLAFGGARKKWANLAEKWSKIGGEKKGVGDLQGAIKAYKKVLKYRKTGFDLHNLGSLYSRVGDHGKACEVYKEAVELEPEHHALINNAGSIFTSAGRRKEAIGYYKKAWKLSKRKNELYGYNYGLTLIPNDRRELMDGDRKHLLRARKVLKRVLTINYNFPEVHWKLGIIEAKMNGYHIASKHFLKSLLLDKQGHSRRLTRSEVLYDLHDSLLGSEPTPDYSGAINALREAVGLGEDSSQKQNLYYRCICALAHLMRYTALYNGLDIIDAQVYGLLRSAIDRNTEDKLSMTPMRALSSFMDSTTLFSLMTSWGKHISTRVGPSLTFDAGKKSATGETAIRIGFVSSDFGSKHPMMHLLENIFSMFSSDGNSFLVHLYSLAPLQKRPIKGILSHVELAENVHSFRSIYGMHDLDAAKLIAKDSIDVLFDLNGFTSGGRPEIFAHRPSKLQVGFLGWPCTIGNSKLLDYAIVDAKTAIVEEVSMPGLGPDGRVHRLRQYAEKLIVLPPSIFVGDHRRKLPYYKIKPHRNRRDLGIPKQSFVYSNFNQLFKVSPSLLDIWANVFRRARRKCHEGRIILWLLRHPGAAEYNIIQELLARGVPEHHLFFSDFAPQEQYVGRIGAANVVLDNVEYNAGATGVDTMWAGTPSITMPRDTLVRRMGKSLAAAVNIQDGIVYSMKAYEDLAVSVCRKQGKFHRILKDMREALETVRVQSVDGVPSPADKDEHTSALFRPKQWVKRFAKGIESAVSVQRSSDGSDAFIPPHIVI